MSDDEIMRDIETSVMIWTKYTSVDSLAARAHDLVGHGRSPDYEDSLCALTLAVLALVKTQLPE
jgi:hypothetical protein